MTHQIIKRDARDFYCPVCEQSWVSQPRSYCPKLKVYRFGRWDHLMTKTQLSNAGYSITKAALPKPVGCYKRVKEGDYVLLYDPTQAQRKRQTKAVRVTYYLDAVFWPKACFPLLDQYLACLRKDRDVYDSVDPHGMANEIALMAVSLGCFSDAEARAHADGVRLAIEPAMLVHRRYGTHFWDERQKLAQRIAEAYKRHIYVPPPPPSAEELERRRLRKEELARENAARTAEIRAKLFQPVSWATQDEGLPPAVQKPLFDEEA